jgi:HK97 family phage prohead protease
MDLPAELFVRAVPNSDDIVAFQFPVNLEAKALEDGTPGSIVEVLEDGDLIIQGFAAEFEGQDRQGENFTDGAFTRGIKSFLSGPASLCFHHKAEKILGKVLELNEVPGRGLWMKARVDGAIKNHPELGTYYQQIKKGTLTGLSVGGFFKRMLTDAGRKISDMDFTEISITPVPMHSKPSFSIVAGKALEDGPSIKTEPAPKDPTYETEGKAASAVLDQLSGVLDTITRVREGKSVKGDPQDTYFLALLLELEQMGNHIASSEDVESGGPVDAKVDDLVKRVSDALDQFAREAHKLAAKLGPLPKITYA